MKHIATAIAALLIAAGATAANRQGSAVTDVLPRPVRVEAAKGEYRIPSGGLTYAIKTKPESRFRYSLEEFCPAPWGKASVKITCGDAADESYTLKITSKGIMIDAPGQAGAFYAIQTLRQLAKSSAEGKLPCMTISDKPRFGYRGLHFDVSRHFRSVDFLKKQIDAMAGMKLNRLHLHFTDGAGWRMPVESYPRLNSYAAWRPQRSWSDWRNAGAGYCDESTPGAYGGYYSKEELRDLVNYAAARNITVIPEIEMPGHSEEVVAAYPELGCTGSTGSSDLCPGKESTFTFLEKVLDETMEIFPSEYIHIGGDEAGKAAWRTCPDCARRMQEEGLSTVEELQSYLIKRIEKYLNSKGRHIIGWDEILEGGVAPNATVMSWRGTANGLQAIAEGHDVVMTPGEYCYIDYSQDAPFREPASIGGYTPLEKVYSYEPMDEALSEADAHHLLGVQANLWSEYVTEDSHAEYMYYPRAYAIAEIGWSTPEKDYPDFRRRALVMNDRLKADGYDVFDLANEYGQRRESLTPVEHLAKGAKVTYATPYNSKYKAGGDTTLTDGLRGGWTYGDHRWQGWLGDAEMTVDLGAVKPLHYLDASFMHSEGAWVHLPDYVTWSVSDDGTNFTEAGTVWCDMDATYPKIMFKSYGLPIDTQARFIKLTAKGNPRPGAWLFLDEIIVK